MENKIMKKCFVILSVNLIFISVSLCSAVNSTSAKDDKINDQANCEILLDELNHVLPSIIQDSLLQQSKVIQLLEITSQRGEGAEKLQDSLALLSSELGRKANNAARVPKPIFHKNCEQLSKCRKGRDFMNVGPIFTKNLMLVVNCLHAELMTEVNAVSMDEGILKNLKDKVRSLTKLLVKFESATHKTITQFWKGVGKMEGHCINQDVARHFNDGFGILVKGYKNANERLFGICKTQLFNIDNSQTHGEKGYVTKEHNEDVGKDTDED